MQNFIVLGIIPGTNIQLDFNDVVLIGLSLLTAAVLLRYILKHSHRIELDLAVLAAPVITEEATA